MSGRQSDKIRLLLTWCVLGSFFILLLGRLFWLQVVKGDELGRMAVGVRARDQVLEPVRGIIYDRNHTELVGNIPVSSIYVNPDIFNIKPPGPGETAVSRQLRDDVAARMSAAMGLKKEDILKILDSGKPFAWLKHRSDYDTCQKVKKLIDEFGLTGVGFAESSMRSYSQGSMAANILGFVGMDPSARGGIENSYDAELYGIPGRLATEIDAEGRILTQIKSSFHPPVNGNNLVLTIDRSIQYYVERALDDVVQKYNPSRAIILAMDPSTGEILASGTRPTFDPARYSSYPISVWESNPITHFNYEPGSILKILVAAAALEEGTVRENDRFYDPGFEIINGERVNCWKRIGHGAETFAEGVKNSCNTVYIKVGLALGRDRLYKYYGGFGLGRPTGIGLPGEERGLVIPREKAIDLDVATMAIGQSIAVTPIQLITAVSAVANGGFLLRPHLVKEVESPDGKTIKKIEPEVVRQVISRDTSRQVGRLLRDVVADGTGKNAFIEGYAVAGKTGTAEIPGEDGYLEGKYISSFAGYAPADNPQITVLVIVAEPKGKLYYGSDVAAPVFQVVARDILHYLNVPADPGITLPKEENTGSKATQEPAVPEKIVIPSILGFPLEEAKQVIIDAGLALRIEGGTKAGVVSEQKPGAGETVKKGSSVNVKVEEAGQSSPILVPDLKGLSIRKAAEILHQLGLEFKSTGSGLAASQNPGPGQRVARGTLVTVEFAAPEKSSP